MGVVYWLPARIFNQERAGEEIRVHGPPLGFSDLQLGFTEGQGYLNPNQ